MSKRTKFQYFHTLQRWPHTPYLEFSTCKMILPFSFPCIWAIVISVAYVFAPLKHTIYGSELRSHFLNQLPTSSENDENQC